MSPIDGEMRCAVDLGITPDVTKIPPAGERLSSFDLKGDNSHRTLLCRFVPQPGQAAICTCNLGVDDDGDYVTGLDGSACHWTGVDAVTGQILKTSLGTTSLTG
jgi:hypothetical protein